MKIRQILTLTIFAESVIVLLFYRDLFVVDALSENFIHLTVAHEIM